MLIKKMPKKTKKITYKVKAKPKAKPKTKALTLIKTPMSNAQLLMVLQKTPANHIYQRKAKGGGYWDYVTGVYIKKSLNYIFGWMWDFQIVDKGKEGDLVWVQGRLTIKNKQGNPMIIKEQFGRADVKFKRNSKVPLDYGNDLKAAATDALKKCASELGIASDIYGKNEFRDIQKQDKGFIPPKEENDNVPEPRKPEAKLKDQPSKKLDELKNALNGKTDKEKLVDLKKRSHIIMKNFDITEKHAGIILAQLLNLEIEM